MTADLTITYPDGDGPDTIPVPEPIRAREVWTLDDRKILVRAMRLLTERGLTLKMRCAEPACAESALDKVDQPDGSFVLRCDHLDRLFTIHF